MKHWMQCIGCLEACIIAMCVSSLCRSRGTAQKLGLPGTDPVSCVRNRCRIYALCMLYGVAVLLAVRIACVSYQAVTK